MTDSVISYADLIEAQQEAVLKDCLERLDPYSDLWSDILDQYGEAELIRLGVDI